MGDVARPKTGGRVAGTPNKTSAKVRAFFAEALELAFADPDYKDRLVRSIVNDTIDAKLFALIVNHAAGMPPRSIEHSGTISHSLEELVAGRLRRDESYDDEGGS